MTPAASTQQDAAVLVLRPRGRLDGSQANRLRAQLVQELGVGPRQVVVDLSAVDFIDSMGIGLLAVLAKHARAAGGEVVLCNVQAPVRRSLEVTHMHQVFDIFDDHAAAGRLAVLRQVRLNEGRSDETFG